MINWWSEAKNIIPPCTYYLDYLSRKNQAKFSEYNYVENLSKEKEHRLTVEIKKLEPKELLKTS